MSKNVLITGSEGFIGSHIVQLLLKKKYKVRAFVYYNSFNNIGWLSSLDKDELKKINIHFGDIRDEKNVMAAFKNIDYVIHLAALIGIPYSYNSPKSYIETNVLGTYNVLEASLKKKIKRLLVTSTSEVYGSAKKIPIDENHVLQGQSPYAATKIAADKLTESYCKSFDLNATIVRPFNTYGPRQSNRAIIPTIITQILNKNSLKIGSLTPKRDFNYVENVAETFEKILVSSKLKGEEVNISSGKSISIRDLIYQISRLLKKNIKIKVDKSRIRPKNSEVNNLQGSSKKLDRIIKAKKISLNEGLKKTIDWFKNKKNLIKYDTDKYIL